jgi:hypothetical protein
MSRAQGPRAKRGDATAANVAGRRRLGVSVMFDMSEAADMSRAQGPRAKRGDATAANVAGRRRLGVSVMFDMSEAAKVSHFVERYRGY